MKRSRSWVLASALTLLPALARADQLEVPPYAAVPPCIDRSDAPIVGSVVALAGAVSIESPGCTPVAAECGMGVHAGQTLVTGSDAQVALLAGGRYVQIGADSRVAATVGDGTTRIAVERGAARVIEVERTPGPAVVLATPAIETRDPGADVMASVSPSGGSSICSYADPIQVVEAGRSTSVSPGSCAGAPRATAEVVAFEGVGAAALPISIAEVGRCDVAAGGPPPTNVASGPPGSSLPPTPPPLPPPTYCQGGSCLPTPVPEPPPPPPAVCCEGGILEPPVIFEPPPD